MNKTNNTNGFSFISYEYNIGPIILIKKVVGGFSTKNYTLKTENGGIFFLKEYSEEVNNIKFVEFSEGFFQKAFPVIKPILSRKNKKYIEYCSKKYVLYPYLNHVIKKTKNLNGEFAYNLGKFLAELHIYSKLNNDKYKNVRINKHSFDRDKTIVIFNKVLNVIKKSKKNIIFDRLAISLVKKRIKYILEKKDRKCVLDTNDYALLHGDYNHENVFFNKSGDIINIFDFEKTIIGSINYEIINTIIIVFFYGYRKQNFDRTEIFLNGYQNVRKIDRKEFKKCLSFFISELFYTTIFEEERYLNDNYRLSRVHIHYYNSLMYFSNNNCFIKKILKMIN